MTKASEGKASLRVLPRLLSLKKHIGDKKDGAWVGLPSISQINMSFQQLLKGCDAARFVKVPVIVAIPSLPIA